MSSSFAVDSNNNMIIRNGEFVLVQDGAQVVQNVRQNLLSYLEDFFLDRTQGVPYYQRIFSKPVDLNDTETILKEVILSTEGVQNLTEFATDFNGTTRELTVTTRFRTIYDTIEGVTLNV